MGMALETEPRYWIPEDVLALPADGNRYECIDGELLVSPAPPWPHQLVVSELHARLFGYLRDRSVGVMLIAPADVRLETSSIVQPDLFVVPRSVAPVTATDWTALDRLLLAVEVLSPSTARYDRLTKRAFYQRAGVDEYWIVDRHARVVERWCPTDERPEIVATELRWKPVGAADPS